MKNSEAPIITISDWLATPAGCYIHAWERACLDLLTADIFGFNAVQVGLPQLHALAANRMAHRWQTDQQVPSFLPIDSKPVVVLHDFAELPFATQSLDLVVLPHVLEFAAHPHQVLREVERVLIPEGQVIICGFNPASLWGMRQSLHRIGGKCYLPSQGSLISLPRLKDWMQLLNMEVNEHYFGAYALPFSSYRWLNRCEFLERAGARWWPYLGAVYVVRAIKRVKTMTLIGPAWRHAAAPVKNGVVVTNKSQNEQSF
jgi:SAM-dependent methyltransferase